LFIANDYDGGDTRWAGGPWWDSDYPLLIDPVGGQDQPSVRTLAARIE
jgi:hypothetical protein